MSSAATSDAASPQLYRFEDDGKTPNNPRLPLILYRNVLRVPAGRDPAAVCEDMFAGHGWANGWRNGIHPFLHFHTRTHEVLGIARGTARVEFGGDKGRTLDVQAGDVVVLPAGTGHRRVSSSPTCWSSAPIRRPAVRSTRRGPTRSIPTRRAGRSPMSAGRPRIRSTARMGRSPNSGPIAEGVRRRTVTAASAARRGFGTLSRGRRRGVVGGRHWASFSVPPGGRRPATVCQRTVARAPVTPHRDWRCPGSAHAAPSAATPMPLPTPGTWPPTCALARFDRFRRF